jgi:hypothetical protein
MTRPVKHFSLRAKPRVSVRIDTARGWVSRGRSGREPYAAWAKALDEARSQDGEDAHPTGPVERSVTALLRGRELKGENQLTAVQAHVLARAIDNVAASSAAAAKGLPSLSKRLDECVAALCLPPDNEVERIRRKWLERRERPAPSNNGRPRAVV